MLQQNSQMQQLWGEGLLPSDIDSSSDSQLRGASDEATPHLNAELTRRRL